MDTFLQNKPGNPGLKIEAKNVVSLSGKTFLVFLLSQIKTNIHFFFFKQDIIEEKMIQMDP